VVCLLLAGLLTAPDVPFLTGGDLSLLGRIEQLGGVFREGGRPVDLIAALKAKGGNCVRLRLFHHPNGIGPLVNDLPYTVALGKRVKDAGLYFLLDLHYSDTWADPAHQIKPAAWEKLSLDELVAAVHDDTRDVLAALRAAGAAPDMVQVGNEITPGFLWPDGRTDKPHWPGFVRLLKAGIQGVKDGAGASAPAIMIHLDRGGDAGMTRWFFDELAKADVPYDVIGQSFYPIWHGDFTALERELSQTARRYHKPLVVVETAYAWRTWAHSEWSDAKKNHLVERYPITPEGQRDYLRDLIALVRRTPEGLGRGVLWWAPEWMDVPGLGGSCADRALVDEKGNLLPAWDALRP
jgi:arabinogalactan endo-1,4-beta-galactosidase